MAPSDPSTLSTTPTCPKCGYDQSGEVATWESQCPLEGRCPECGLVFAWGEVFDPVLNDLYWYVEHGKSLMAMVRRTPRTLAWLILPHRFWQAVDVTKRVAIWRLMIWVLLLMVGAHLLVSVPYGFGAWHRYNWRGVSFADYYASNGLHGVGKIFIDGLAHPALETNFRGGGRWPTSLHFGVGRAYAIYDQIVKPTAFQIGFVLLWMIVLVVIPKTRELVQVRWSHIGRVLALSALMLVLWFEFYRLFYAMMMWTQYRSGLVRDIHQLIIPIAILWQIVFWSSAIAIGWRVYSWRLLVALGTVAALLGGTALRVYVFLASTI